MAKTAPAPVFPPEFHDLLRALAAANGHPEPTAYADRVAAHYGKPDPIVEPAPEAPVEDAVEQEA